MCQCECECDDSISDEELMDEIDSMEKACPWVFGILITALVCAVLSLPVLGIIKIQDFKQLHSNCEEILHEVAP